ncbi:MAG: YlxR family protein [Dehalococcoidia bacterium]|nr:YlxR family protein [Dehalococcoidia bacterium]
MSARRGKQPQRTCVACRRSRDRRDLVRLVRTAEGEIDVDERGREPGRGAYLCAERECWDRALSGAALANALRVSPGTNLGALREYADRTEAGRSGS